MTNIEDILNKLLPSLTARILVLVALLAAVLQLLGLLEQILNKILKPLWNKILKPLWNKVLKPCAKFLIFLGILTIPIGLIIWYFMYLVAQNSSRLVEAEVFLSLVVQLTIAVSLYALLWGAWLHPKLWPLLVKRKRNAQRPSDSNQPSANSRQKSNIESPNDIEYQ